MNSPFSNRKLQRYFASISEEQFSNYCEELGCCIPTNRFDAVYMMLHMLRHVLDEGVGLRQLLDYYYLLIKMTPQEKDQAIKDIQQLGILGFASGMMFVMQEVLGVGQSILLCSPDAKQGAFLLEEIMLSGNFGRFDKRNAHEKNESHIRHARRKLRRALRFLKYYPGEVLFMPAFMAWQYFWRRKNGYFYKGK